MSKLWLGDIRVSMGVGQQLNYVACGPMMTYFNTIERAYHGGNDFRLLADGCAVGYVTIPKRDHAAFIKVLDDAFVDDKEVQGE